MEFGSVTVTVDAEIGGVRRDRCKYVDNSAAAVVFRRVTRLNSEVIMMVNWQDGYIKILFRIRPTARP